MRAALTLVAALTLAAAPVMADARPRPDPVTDEGGLWDQSDRAEAAARAKAELNTDAALTGYVRDVACRVAAESCGEIRVYVMDRPFFNAAMAPNGYMEVWSGLLLRARSESELAFVLGHETGHYAEGHSLTAWRAMKTRANVVTAVSVVIAVAGVAVGVNGGASGATRSILDAAGTLSDIVYLASVASFFAFSRDQEREADRLGFTRAVTAGYDPSAGAALWRSLRDETAASDFAKVRERDTLAGVFATHPVTAERIAALGALAEGLPRPAADDRARYRAAIRPHLATWLKDDLRRRDYGQTLHLIDRLAQDGEDLGVLDFYRGEALRRRRGDGDQQRAMAAYRAASARPDAPVAVWRELGDLQAKAGLTDEARAAYATYLEKAPAAQDRWLVEGSLAKLPGAAT